MAVSEKNQDTQNAKKDVTIIPLRTPIKAYGEEVSHLEMRAANAEDARILKALPYSIGNDESVNLNLDVCARYISRLCNIPMSSVDQLNLNDLNNLAWQVAGFFFGGGSEA